jgi:SAM-dependent methyltransferase
METLIKRAIPHRLYSILRSAITTHRKWQTRRSLKRGLPTPEWLEEPMIRPLQERYPPFEVQQYDPESLIKRGREQAQKITSLCRKHKLKAKSFLELGCGSGHVSGALINRGNRVTGVDLISEDYDPKTRKNGLDFVQSDVTRLPFRKNSFDFIYSFDSFEHISNPEDSLREATAVLVPGGHIYLNFGPLYRSPFGLHAYHTLPIPYLQHLFPKQVLDKTSADRKLDPINWAQVNRWTIRQYRDMWRKNSATLKPVFYREHLADQHLDLVREFPSCFRSKIEDLDDLVIASVEVLFQKKMAGPDDPAND